MKIVKKNEILYNWRSLLLNVTLTFLSNELFEGSILNACFMILVQKVLEDLLDICQFYGNYPDVNTKFL